MGRTFDFIATSGDGVFAVDRRQSIVLWNKTASEILGFTAEEVLGERCYEIVCGRDAQGCIVCRCACQAITSAERLEPALTADIEFRAKGGAKVWVNLSTVVVPSRCGELSVLVHMFREVTRQHDLLRAAEDFAAVLSGHSSQNLIRRSRDVSSPATCVELTRREREILICLASGTSTDVIAEKLSISPRTVRNHVNSILRKLGVHSRLEAVAYSIKNGLI